MDNQTTPATDGFSLVTIALLKGIIYQENDPSLWQHLLTLQPRVRDYVKQIGLELIIDESEGYGWLQTHPDEEGETPLPRLVQRRQLPFNLSLLLALLRKRMAEFDNSGGDDRLILTHEEIAEMIRLFLPENSNETKIIKQICSQINRAVEMGFLRRLKGQEETVEVRRILNAFVNAQWLQEFDQRLAEYQKVLSDEK